MSGLFDDPLIKRLPEGYPVPTFVQGQPQGLPEGFLPSLLEAVIDPKPTDPSL